MDPKPLPKWILIVSGIVALLELAVSISLWISPAAMLEDVDLQAKGAIFLVYMWASRQFALGFIFAFATARRSASMLTLCYIFFLVMMIGDILVGIRQNELPMIITPLIMCFAASAMLLVINRKKMPSVTPV